MKQYNKSNIPLARQLRKSMTPWERKLWYEYLRYYPVRFQRQKAIGEYIADFYCAKAGLVIELDGSGHYEKETITADAIRTKALESMNLKVLRICNLDVDRNFTGVCEYIHTAVDHRVSLPSTETTDAGKDKTTPQSTHRADSSPDKGSRRTIFALGFFDGVHLGHQTLLAECCRIAREHDATACAITFQQHPQTLFTDTPPKLINTEADRMQLLRGYGIGPIYSYPVTEEVMSMSWQAFLDELISLGSVGYVCGRDFHFGNRGEGNAEKLMAYCKEKNLLCSIVGDQMLDGIRISSTHIRQLLQAGDIDTANRFLGHPHTLTGKVVSGRGIGRTIGVPTANLQIAEDVCLPRQGVYACTALVDGHSYVTVTNIGSRPTVGGNHITVEPWLLDFEGDLYGRELTLLFHRFLREEKKFDSLAQLQEEIQKNALQARKIIEKS